jgi:hypothetical protein
MTIIIGAGIFVANRNFTPGTWLAGWDDLMPELNFKLNITRSLSAVWQEYQGLGLLGGMAHAADLPRQIILWAFSFVLPGNALRYLWAYLMLVLGPLGVYFMVSGGLIKTGGFASKIAGFASAVFYIFNLATVQTFYTPFETFINFYGLVPWLLYFTIDYLKSGGRQKLLFYFLISVLATCAFYVQTLFIVYAIFLFIISIEAIIRFKKEGVFRVFKLSLVTLFVNAFWLLPALFFTLTSAGIPAASHINSIATPETQLMNVARADFTDIATLKGYWFDYYDWGKNGNYDYLYKTWIGYSNQPVVVKISLALFFVSLAGLAASLFKKKTSYGVSLLVLLGISYFMLAGGQIPQIPFFSDIFRNAFTKWANAAALIYAFGLGYFIFVVSDIFRNKIVKFGLVTLLSTAIIFTCVYTTWPVANGGLIADSMKINLPSYYLDTVNYLKGQDRSARIADFPLTDFWGWKFNDWGYRGSGFLWYGIPQPILDRAFDVWSPFNEAFYNEISHAVEAENTDELKYVLSKYQVSYILFDGSIFEPGNPDSVLIIGSEKKFLESSPFITKAKEFGKITIYQVNLDKVLAYVSAPKEDLSSPFIVTGKKSATPVITETFSDSQGYKNANNCSLMGIGSVSKSKLDGGDYYAAYNGGISCDYFYYPTLDYSQAYYMRIIGKNISGRSLKFYLYNIKDKNAIIEELLPTGNFDKSYLILPTESRQSAKLGYTLNVETRSFGKVKSENLVTGIEFYPVGYMTKRSPLQSNNLEILGVKKYGTWGYRVETSGTGLLELGQGYDKGWVAFALQPNFKFLEHIKVDSWANGWIIEKSHTEGGYSISNLKSQIWIVYWPQLLEWGGGVLGVSSLIFIVLKKRKEDLLDNLSDV